MLGSPAVCPGSSAMKSQSQGRPASNPQPPGATGCQRAQDRPETPEPGLLEAIRPGQSGIRVQSLDTTRTNKRQSRATLPVRDGGDYSGCVCAQGLPATPPRDPSHPAPLQQPEWLQPLSSPLAAVTPSSWGQDLTAPPLSPHSSAPRPSLPPQASLLSGALLPRA